MLSRLEAVRGIGGLRTAFCACFHLLKTPLATSLTISSERAFGSFSSEIDASSIKPSSVSPRTLKKHHIIDDLLRFPSADKSASNAGIEVPCRPFLMVRRRSSLCGRAPLGVVEVNLKIPLR